MRQLISFASGGGVSFAAMAPFLSILLAQQTSGGGTGGAFLAGGFLLVFIIIAIIASLFWIWMLIDCLMSNKTGADKIIWVLVILFLHIVGAILYFALARGNSSIA